MPIDLDPDLHILNQLVKGKSGGTGFRKLLTRSEGNFQDFDWFSDDFHNACFYVQSMSSKLNLNVNLNLTLV